MALKLPRKGTRVRAIFDLMYKNAMNGHGPTRFLDAKIVYDNTEPAYNNRMFGPRYHSGMNVSRTMHKFGYRIRRGYYSMIQDWIIAGVAEFNKSNPCAEITLPSIAHDVACTCRAMVWERNNRTYLNNTYPDGYKSINDKGMHFLDGRPCIPFKKPEDVRAVPRPCTDPNCLTCCPQPDPADRFVARKVDLIDDERVKVIEALEDTIASKNKTIETLKTAIREVATEIVAVRDGTVYVAARRLTDLYNHLKTLT